MYIVLTTYTYTYIQPHTNLSHTYTHIYTYTLACMSTCWYMFCASRCTHRNDDDTHTVSSGFTVWRSITHTHKTTNSDTYIVELF